MLASSEARGATAAPLISASNPSSLNEMLVKSLYSISNTSQLTESYGIKAYRPYTIRKACSDGRISEAQKLDDGKTWAIPREALLRILDEGIPPERRN